MEIPEQFSISMQNLLGNQYSQFINSILNDEPVVGLRVNTLKLSPNKLKALLPFELLPVNWCLEGFYHPQDVRPSKSPFYSAGLYYIQEPSAMSAASVLEICPNDKVLDLCAAPGGKTTQLAAKLNNTGLLVANDISASRCKALQKNIELFGITNAVITSESPKKLATAFSGFFNKILIDAPCSGEGMFRKLKQWDKHPNEYYNNIQKQIIQEASALLADGGKMVYSTCTFAAEENEQVIQHFLSNNPNFKLLNIEHSKFNFEKGFNLESCARILPHKQKGEGHFIAYLAKETKKESRQTNNNIQSYPKIQNINYYFDFCKKYLNKTLHPNFNSNFLLHGSSLFLVPNGVPCLKGIRVARSGFHLGEMKKGRFEPSQALAMALTAEDAKNVVNLKADSKEVLQYLNGESPDIDSSCEGYALVCVENFPLGFGKVQNGRLKNKRTW